MPRIRTVKPEFWTDSKVVALSMPARLMFIGAWNYADDHGCLPEDALQLKLRVLPADPVDAEELVGELLDAELLEVLVAADGERFWHVRHWDRHQRVSHPKDSDFGAPETWRKVISGADANPREISGGFMGEGKGRERKGRDVVDTSCRRPPAGAPPEELAIHAVFEERFGVPSDTDLGLRRKVAKSLLAAGGDAEEVDLRAAAWESLFPAGNGRKPATLTPTALDKWWGQLGKVLEDIPEEFNPDECAHPDDRRAVFDDAEFCGVCRKELHAV